MKILNEQQLKSISDATFKKTADIGLRHAQENSIYIKKTIRDLRKEIVNEPPKPVIVISAGPSLHRKKSIETIKKADFKGCIVAVDGSLGHCLRNGIVPDFVVTVDPDAHRIIRWFGDPRLSERPEDDYFQRQDLDPALNKDEVARNQELIDMVNYYGPQIKGIVSTSVTCEITQRCLDAGMNLYWWNPLYDDYESKDSLSKKLYRLNKVPCMVTGGNVGSSAWVFSHTILNAQDVLLVGMDFSYPPGTEVRNTQYYEILQELFPGKPEKGLIEVYNPHLKETWVTDPAYYWYSQIFIEMSQKSPCKTYNCTEGGILFGGNIEFVNLKEALFQVLQTKES